MFGATGGPENRPFCPYVSWRLGTVANTTLCFNRECFRSIMHVSLRIAVGVHNAELTLGTIFEEDRFWFEEDRF